MRELDALFKRIESVPDFCGHTINSVYYTNGHGDTPLHIVATWGDCAAINLLIAAGAPINAIGETGYTPLHCASEQNHPAAVALLLSLGAVSMEDENGYTPRALAHLLGHREALTAFAGAV